MPEYDRAVTEQNGKLRAAAELTDRQRLVRKLGLRPLSASAKRQGTADWTAIQEEFADSPHWRCLRPRHQDNERSRLSRRRREQAMADLSLPRPVRSLLGEPGDAGADNSLGNGQVASTVPDAGAADDVMPGRPSRTSRKASAITLRVPTEVMT